MLKDLSTILNPDSRKQLIKKIYFLRPPAITISVNGIVIMLLCFLKEPLPHRNI